MSSLFMHCKLLKIEDARMLPKICVFRAVTQSRQCVTNFSYVTKNRCFKIL